jgi:hypothetical protein
MYQGAGMNYKYLLRSMRQKNNPDYDSENGYTQFLCSRHHPSRSRI